MLPYDLLICLAVEVPHNLPPIVTHTVTDNPSSTKNSPGLQRLDSWKYAVWRVAQIFLDHSNDCSSHVNSVYQVQSSFPGKLLFRLCDSRDPVAGLSLRTIQASKI